VNKFLKLNFLEKFLATALLVGGFFVFNEVQAARTITSATLNGVSSVTVKGSTSITAAVTVYSGGSGNKDWKGTKYTIEDQSPICIDTPDHSTGTSTESFNITAPLNTGKYTT
jgi:hypothetical protein